MAMTTSSLQSQLQTNAFLHVPWPHRVLFSHANGFPTRSYSTFLRALSPAGLRYVPCIGKNLRYALKQDWQPLLLPILDLLHVDASPAVGIGHSMGAILTLQAYYICPAAFSHIILIDPPLFSKMKRCFIHLFQCIGQADVLIYPARKAKRRRTHWNSREEAGNYLREKPLFKILAAEAVQDYLNYALEENEDGGVSLVISRDIEYQIFCSVPVNLQVKHVDIPCYVLYSTRYQASKPSGVRSFAKKLPSVRFIPMDFGHMAPLEAPVVFAQFIRSLIS